MPFARFCPAAATAVLLGCPAAAAQVAHKREGIEEIVVVATKLPQPVHTVAASVSTFDRERLEWEQARELGDIARYEPALEAEWSSPRFGDSGIAIRGIGGNRVALEFDGVPLPQQFAVGSFADSSRLVLDTAIVGRAEVLRGPASALYGSDAIGGVIALASPDPRDLIAPGRNRYLAARGGRFGVDDGWTGQATMAWAGDRDGLLASGNYRSGDEPENRARGVPDDEIDTRQWQAFGKWAHEFADGAALGLSGDYFRRSTDSDTRSVLGSGRFANTTSILGDDVQDSGRVVAEFSSAGFLGAEETVARAYWQANDTSQKTDELRFAGPAELLIERDFSMEERDCGGEVRGRWDLATGAIEHVLLVGGEWDRQNLLQLRDGRQTRLATGNTSNVILGEAFPLRDMPDTTVDEFGIYVQDEMNFGRLMLIPGARWDYFDLDAQTDELFTDPARLTGIDNDKLSLRLGATVELADWATAYAHYAEGFRAPPPADVNLYLDIPLFNYRSLPNPDLKPEQSRNLEGGLRIQGGGTAVEIAGYYSRYEDFIESRALIGSDPVTGGLIFQSRNLDEASIWGIEAGWHQELAVLHPIFSDWRLQGGLHWAHGENDVDDAPLNEVAPLKAVMNLYWEPAEWPLRAGFRIRHYGHQDRADFRGGEFFVPPAATVMDLTLRWLPVERMAWLLSLNNLANQRYWIYADAHRFAPGDPRIEVASQPGFHANLTLNLRF
jgi:hemoglobin/transferrin/lactoferrin receptor protein